MRVTMVLASLLALVAADALVNPVNSAGYDYSCDSGEEHGTDEVLVSLMQQPGTMVLKDAHERATLKVDPVSPPLNSAGTHSLHRKTMDHHGNDPSILPAPALDAQPAQGSSPAPPEPAAGPGSPGDIHTHGPEAKPSAAGAEDGPPTLREQNSKAGFDTKLFSETQPADVGLLVVCLLIPFVLMLLMNKMSGLMELMHGFRQRQPEAKEDAPASDRSTDRRSLPNLKFLDLQSQQKQVDENGTAEENAKEDSTYFTHFRSVLAGVSIASVCLPDAISFSFLAGTSPLNGIWAGVIMSLCSATVGGRPGMISSASGATAIILARVKADGLNHSEMAMAVIIAGTVQGICAVFQLARFIYLVPHSVIIGFVNGLAVVIFRSQLRQFYTDGGAGPMVDMITFWGMLLTAVLAMLTTLVYPRIPVVSKHLPLPPAFVALVVCFAFAYIFQPVFPPRTLVEVAGPGCFMGGIHVVPHWFFPPPEMRWSSHETWARIVPIGIRFGLAGLIESILTELLIDQITETQGSTARESYAQSLGNLISGCFGLQGGCALVGQSLMNVANGGVSRVAGVATSMTLLASVVLLSQVIGMIPVACLMGLIFLITLQMFNWGSFSLCWRLWKAETLGTRLDALVIVIVTVVTIIADLGSAVILGVCLASVGFAWDSTRTIECEQIEEEDKCTLKLHGKLFFASALRFQKLFTPSKMTQKSVLVDFTNTSCLDFSAINAIETLRDRFAKAGKDVAFKAVPDDFIAYLPSDMKFVNKDSVPADAKDEDSGRRAQQQEKNSVAQKTITSIEREPKDSERKNSIPEEELWKVEKGASS